MHSESSEPGAVDPHQQTVEAVLVALATNAGSGLSQAEACARLERWGRNELAAEKPVPAWRRFLAQFTDVLVILLLVAALISAGLWLYERDSALPYEAIAIFAIVLLNAVMGYVQEARAEPAVAALREMSAAHAAVIRDGARQSIPAAELVPGDVILVEEGDTIPADARLIQSTALQTAEAALTGESLPVSKDIAPIPGEAGLGDRHNMIFSGTAGDLRARPGGRHRHRHADRDGAHRRHAEGDAADEATPLQKELDRVGKLLGLVVVVIAVVMIATIVLVEDVRGFSAIFDVLILGVALAVAAVPEGLPAVVTAVLSLGVQRMARRNAIVRHLAAVETLGSANVIASDKTGTLTRNEMTVRVVVDRERPRRRSAAPATRRRASVRPRGRRGGRRAAADRAGARARRRRPRQQRRPAGARRALDGAGRSDRRRADRRGAQGRAGGRGARRALRARRRGAVLVRAQADEHGPHATPSARSGCSCSPRARPTCCWRAARTSSSARRRGR